MVMRGVPKMAPRALPFVRGKFGNARDARNVVGFGTNGNARGARRKVFDFARVPKRLGW